MSIKDDLDKLITEKSEAVESLKIKLGKEESYLQALNDTHKIITLKYGPISRRSSLRPSGALYKVRETILEAEKPLHIDEILSRLGKSVEDKPRLVSSMSHYLRLGEIFTRPAPNTFGLKELEETTETAETQ